MKRGENLRAVEKKFSAEYQPENRRTSTKPLTDLLLHELNEEKEIRINALDPLTRKPVTVIIPATNKVIITKALLLKAAKGDTKAIEIIYDRTEGKVPMPLQMSGQLELSAKSRQELSRIEDLDIEDAEFDE